MYLRILKKDMKRKKTMNIILLIFVILAATFIASSANNLITISTALDNYLEKAGVPDYWFAVSFAEDLAKFEELAKDKGYQYDITRLLQINPKEVTVDGTTLGYSQTLALSKLGGTKIFDKNNKEFTKINDGEAYLTVPIYNDKESNIHEGSKILVKSDGIEKEFTVKGYVKDVMFGSEMVGISRIFLSENDFKLFDTKNACACSSVLVYTKDADYLDNFNALGLNSFISADHAMMKMMYFMDSLLAAIMLVVSVCLILVSMVILRFIINFTITEEFREIGVMKAIGIKNNAIRGLYIVKYLALSAIGTAAGLILSFPFGKMMIDGVSQKIVISGEDNYAINIAAAVLAGAFVVLFSYFCTRKIRKFSPIDAIRSGETGERYSKKGVIHLSRSKLTTTAFLAANDILSGIKNYVSMILIFILGTLLVIIPINTINTLRSDNLVTLFNMTKSDHIISLEVLFNPNENNMEKINRQFSKVREMFSEKGIEVDVFQEVMFKANISKGEKLTNSVSFQGIGGVTTDMYSYIKGTAPQNNHEVALSYITADRIDAEIGDDVKITIGGTEKTYTVTAINQSMNNMGEAIRFYQDETLDYNYAAGSFGIQVNYKDNPDDGTLAKRKAMLENLFPNAKIFNSGEYISYMIGDVAGSIQSTETLIIVVVLCINMLVAVLMVKSFITKEKSEIALLKAIGFKNNLLILWQTMRIGMVLFASVIVGVLISSPLSTLIITPIFRMMGAYSIEYEIKTVEVYVVFPLMVLAATALAAFISAQGLRKILSSEISNNE